MPRENSAPEIGRSLDRYGAPNANFVRVSHSGLPLMGYQGRSPWLVSSGLRGMLNPAGKEKPPYAMALGNRGPMLIAGLWDIWKNPAGGQCGCALEPPPPPQLMNLRIWN